MTKEYDIFIVGGGINGCGIARDAVGRGFSVCLAEMNDFASGTSSWSSKLIHGGFRYLEHYEFRLVREALSEREVLLASAPHIIWPLRFVLPHHKAMRPAWLLRLGLFLYDHIGARRLLPGTTALNLTTHPLGEPLKDDYVKGFEYSDCWVNDARLVVLNARDAADRGADLRSRTKVVAARREDGAWTVEMEGRDGQRTSVRAKLIVNAAGPWVDKLLNNAMGKNDAHNVRLVQGSHIIVPKIHDGNQAYIFQHSDGRVIFALPYETDFTLIGTTDRDYEGDPGDAAISPEEISYLCEVASSYFRKPVAEDDIVWTYSGVRPLYDDGATEAQEATRDYVLKRDGDPALINIFGGKITTYRRLAESMMSEIEAVLGKRGGPWTANSTLPGGDFAVSDFADQVAALLENYPFLDEQSAHRLMRLYGTKARDILGDARQTEDLGTHFGASLTQAEVRYLIERELARSADDILWRRTKQGLLFSKPERAALQSFVESRLASGQADST
ncbi:MAG: glycerol-3-phosphate dehydrogenase [Ahrensia sp.]|nr:glycerol-3-phosphate dehydrogenase [Ahrensia sp.]